MTSTRSEIGSDLDPVKPTWLLSQNSFLVGELLKRNLRLGGEGDMRWDRRKIARNRDGVTFVPLPHVVLESPKLSALSSKAVKLLVDLCAQYRGNNNGDLTCAYSLMRKRGWRSETTLLAAKAELLEAGFIAETRKGNFPNRCALFALTWMGLNDCKGKLEVTAASFPRGAYNDPEYVPLEPVRGKRLAPRSGAKRILQASMLGAAPMQATAVVPNLGAIGGANA